MASVLVGRAECPECGEKNAKVKRSEKCLYRYCGTCGAQYHAKNPESEKRLMAKTRPEGSAHPEGVVHSPAAGSPTTTDKPAPTAAPAVAPAPAPVPTGGSSTATSKPARRGLFSMG